MYPPNSVTLECRKPNYIKWQNFRTRRSWWQSAIRPSYASSWGWITQGCQLWMLVHKVCVYTKCIQGLHGVSNTEKGTVIVKKTGAASLFCKDKKNPDFEVEITSSFCLPQVSSLRIVITYIYTVGLGKVVSMPPNSLACTTVLITEILECHSIFNFSFYWEWLWIKKFSDYQQIGMNE